MSSIDDTALDADGGIDDLDDKAATGTCRAAKEDRTATLSCPAGSTIGGITFASYGTPKGTCARGFATGTCHAASSLERVQAACVGKQSCSVDASNDLFGDPCSGVGKRLAVTYTCGGTVPEPPPSQGQGGLMGSYFRSLNLTGQAIVRTDASVNFGWGRGSPDPSLDADGFSVRWAGLVRPRYTQTYTFYTVSDDGVRLWIDGRLIVDNWTEHGETEDSGTIALQAGKSYSVKMEYFESGGDAVAKLLWSSSSQTKQVIPSEQLSSDPGGDSGGGDDPDNCPSDPNKTEPGVCGCGVPEATCGSDGGDGDDLPVFLMAGQSNMIGRVDGALGRQLVNDVSNNNFNAFRSNLENWYRADGAGAPSSAITQTQWNGMVALKNAGLISSALFNPLSGVYCSIFWNEDNTPLATLSMFSRCGGDFGPELMLGHRLAKAGRAPTALVKVAAGGSSLAEEWKPNSFMRNALKGRINDLTSRPTSIHPECDSRTCRFKAFIWFQGENDSFDQAAATAYGQNLRSFIREVRSWTGSPSLPVIIVQIGMWAQKEADYGKLVAKAQETIAQTEGNVTLVKTDDLSEHYHFDPAAQLIIGGRVADKL